MEPKTILLVSDSAPNACVNSLAELQKAGTHRIIWHKNVRNAEEEFERITPDLILLDIYIGSNPNAGRALAERIRAGEFGAFGNDVPMMAVTADPAASRNTTGTYFDTVAVISDAETFTAQINDLLTHGRPKQSDTREKILLIGGNNPEMRTFMSYFADQQNMQLIWSATPDTIGFSMRQNAKRIKFIVFQEDITEEMEQAYSDNKSVMDVVDNSPRFLPKVLVLDSTETPRQNDYISGISIDDPALYRKIEASIIVSQYLGMFPEDGDIIKIAEQLDRGAIEVMRNDLHQTLWEDENAPENRKYASALFAQTAKSFRNRQGKERRDMTTFTKGSSGLEDAAEQAKGDEPERE